MKFKHRMLAAACLLATSTVAFAADTAPPPSPSSEQAQSAVLREGTEVRLRFEDDLSSKTASEGDRFSLSLDDNITLANGVVLKAGYRGAGEVTHAEKRKMMGQAGELNVRIDYLRIGDTRVRLRGQKGGEGDSRVGTTVALTVLFGPLGLLKKGKDIEIKRGQAITVYVDADAEIPLPVAPPPTS